MRILLVTILLVLLVPARAAAEPSFAQLPGAAGCIAESPNFTDCVDGKSLINASSIAISPDGEFAYVTSPVVNSGSDSLNDSADAISIFSRNPATGELTQLGGSAGCVSDDGTVGCANGLAMDGVRSVVVSPDGEHLYAAAGTQDGTDTSGNFLAAGAVIAFARNQETGAITQLAGKAGCISDDGEGGLCNTGTAINGASDIAISPNGENVYVTSLFSDAVTVLSRKAITGELSQSALGGTNRCISNNGTGGECVDGRVLNGAKAVAVSPNGRSVYVTSLFDDAIVILSRNETTGVLTQRSGTEGCITEVAKEGCTDGSRVDAARDVAVSPDNKHVYVVAETSDALTAYTRANGAGAANTGVLTKLTSPNGCHRASGSGCTPAKLLNGVTGVTVSPDGTNVYVTSGFDSDGVAVFDRNTSSGVLTQLPETAACFSETGSGGTCTDAKRLDGAIAPTVSPDGLNVYVPALQSSAVSIFKRLPDGDIDGTSNATDNCPGTANFDQANSDGAGDGGNACDPDDDNDLDLDGADNCPTTANANQTNTDGAPDGGDACDTDDDNDGFADGDDNCQVVANPDQTNTDGLKEGDACDADDDDDDEPDTTDNCQFVPNPDQDDTDHDGFGDACDGDRDGDTVPDATDNCPNVRNLDQLNTDQAPDGGNVCDADDDNDTKVDGADNCRLISNPGQEDNDGTGGGDACDLDDDNDGDPDTADNCRTVANDDQQNSDTDLLGDACDEDDDGDTVPDVDDNCQLVPNGNQTNTDDANDGGDACDEDDDGDLDADTADNCGLVPNPDQEDNDGTGGGDACDDNDDGDAVLDATDNCDFVANPDQEDNDGTGGGDACDDNDDGDAVLDATDNCDFVANPGQVDSDSDAVGDSCDADDDNDGDPDGADNCRIAPNPLQADADRSGGGDACDRDDDNDGVADTTEVARKTSPFDLDSDDDGLGDRIETRTSPRRIDSDGDGLQDGTERGLTKPIGDPVGRVAGTDPAKFRPDRAPKTRTKPLRADTDGDGLKDGTEDRNRNGRFDKKKKKRETNPLKADTDRDGVSDGQDAFPRNPERR